MSVFLQWQGLSVDSRLPDPCNTLLCEPAVLARLSKEERQLHFKMMVDPNDRRSFYWYPIVLRPCDRIRR